MSLPRTLDADAVTLLRSLSGPHGIHASLSTSANYRSIFARDAVMAGVAGLLLDDPEISAGLVRTLEKLRTLQGPEGQIASNFAMRDDGSAHVSFGTLAPRIDSATWYLIGIALGARANALDPENFRDSVASVVRLLDALEYNGRHLIYIPPGGNWADEYVYEGYILYDQVLRAWALRLLAPIYDRPSWIEKSERIGETIAARYWPDDSVDRWHPVASLSPVGVRDRFDLAACCLLALAGVAPKAGSASLAGIAEQFLSRGALPPAFHPVIDPMHSDWPALQRYHLHAFRNLPYEYHNGGIWPIWLGWLALAFAQSGRARHLELLREQVNAHLGRLAHFDFEEFLHGASGAPGGTPRMAYTATGLVFLRLAGCERQARLLAL